MPSSCIVNKCVSGALIKAGRKIAVFRGQENVIEAWRRVVPTVNNKFLTRNHVVCELHFHENEVEKTFRRIINGTIHEMPKCKVTLKEGAVPSIFPYNAEEELVYTNIVEGKQLIEVPSDKWSTVHTPQFILWMNWINDDSHSDRRIVLYPDMTTKVFVFGSEVKEEITRLKTVGDINALFERVGKLRACLSFGSYKSNDCVGCVKEKEKHERGRRFVFCHVCAKLARKLNRKKREADHFPKVKRKIQKLYRDSRNTHRKCERLANKVQTLKQKISKTRSECSESKEELIEEAISQLPAEQQTAIRTCFAASKLTNDKSMRYTTNWVYECILLRIKSKKTYEHLRSREILKLPCADTLSKYLRKLKTSYGFQLYVFEGMKFKANAMEMEDRRGVLLIDEMKLATALHFNRIDLKFEGFTDLGDWTPEDQKQKKGDHALVFMFQPFRGQWVQSLGCFLSVGSACGTVLHKLIIEAIALTESSGFFVDAVVTDGASWNRSMWKMFGVTLQEVSVMHPCCDERRLWFLSDIPHLIKALRNFLIKFFKHTIIYTPDGNISLKHWYALVELLDKLAYELRVNYKLRLDHVRPQYFQKMNVALAFQFFNIHDALEIYENRHADLEDCEGTKKFCKRMTSLIKSMNSRTAFDAMAPNNEAWKIIEDFVAYIQEWEKNARGKFEFMSDSCSYGLQVSLKAALEICTFLTEKCNYSYLMTARLNQDSLERFFALMRDSCGANDHPDPFLFIFMYKLVSTYSLIKPPKGCNVEGVEIFQVLLSLKDVENCSERKEKWETMLETILDKGSCSIQCDENILLEHSYSSSEESEYAIAYVAGYVGKKGGRFARFATEKKTEVCNDCSSTLILAPGEAVPERHKLIHLKTRGFLQHPSTLLYDLVVVLENAIISIVQENNIQADTLFQVTEKLIDLTPIPFVGCGKHREIFTRRILSFYLTTRMLLLCKRHNIIDDKERKLIKEKRKAAKLVGVSKKEKSAAAVGTAMDCCDDPTKIAIKKKRVYKKKNKATPT